MCNALSVSLLALALTSAHSGAQTRVVPAGTTHDEGNAQSFFPFVLQGGRVQQVTAAAEICRTSAILRQLAFRREGASTLAYLARSFTTFTVKVGHTSATPSSMSTTFSSNRGASMTTVFNGAFTAPAQPPVTNPPAPFNIAVKFAAPFVFVAATGNMVWEIEIPGNTTRRVAYFVDGQIGASGGSTLVFGKGGPFSGGDSYSLTSDASKLVPGGQAVVAASGLKNAYPALANYGFSNKQYGAITLPFDLVVVGATNNTLYASLDLLLPMPLSQQGSTFGGSVALPIPAANLAGLTLFGQALFYHQPSNGLGIVFSNAVEMVLGSATQVPSRAIGAYDSSATTGNFAVNSTTGAGGIVEQWEGVFN